MRNRKIHILFVLLFGILSTAFAQPLPQDPRLVKGHLPNGLTYYIYPNAYPKGEAVYRLFIKSGSLQETPQQRGLAHFLEHMAFNGSRHFPDDGMVKFLESKGAKFGKDLNAHTSFGETVYKLQLPCATDGMVDSTLTVMADWAGGLLLDSVQIEKERGVILSEWLSKKGPKEESQNAFIMELLNHSRYSERMTIGDTAIIRHCPASDIRNYYRTWYRPELMAVAVVGDVNPAKVEALIKERFGVLTNENSIPLQNYNIPPYKEEQARIYTNKGLNTITLDILQLSPKSNAVTQTSDYKEYLLRAIVNRLLKNRFNSLTFQNPSYKSASIQYGDILNATNMLIQSVELESGKVKKGIDEFILQQQQIRRYGFLAGEISQVVKSIDSSLKNKVETDRGTSIDLMSNLYENYYVGTSVLSSKQEYELFRQNVSQIDSVSVLNYLHRIYASGRPHYLLRAYDKVSAELPSPSELTAWVKAAESHSVKPYYRKFVTHQRLLTKKVVPGKIVETKAISEIHAQKYKLSNGATVIFKQSDLDKDKILLSGFRAGGLYSLDSVMYNSGTYAGGVIPLSGVGNFTREELSSFLTGKTASAIFLIDKTRSGVSASANLKDMETMFQLLYLKWTEPKVDSDLFRLVVDKTKENYRTHSNVKEEQFQQELGWLMNGKNYTNEELSDSMIDKKVHESYLLPIYHKMFGAAAGYTFVITASVPFSKIQPFVTTYLGGLPHGKVSNEYVLAKRTIPHRNIEFEQHIAKSPKATVSLVYQNEKINGSLQEYQMKADMAKEVIRNILLNRLREEMGKVYSVSVSCGAALQPSPLSRSVVAFICKPEDVDVLVKATQSEMAKLCQQPGSFSEILEDVKRNMLKTDAVNKQRSSFWITSIRNHIFNGETNWNYVTRYAQMVNAVTPAEVAKFIKAAIVDALLIKAVLYPAAKK